MTKKMFPLSIFSLFFSLTSLFVPVQSFAHFSPLTIYVFELKDLVYKNGDSASGTWIEMYNQISREADIKFKYEFMSIPRLEKVLKSNSSGCSLTFFQTNNRKHDGIQFVHIYPDPVAIKIYKRSDDKISWSVDSIKEKKDLKVITNTVVAVDALKDAGIATELIFNFNSIVSMLKFNRVSLIAGSSLAIEASPEFKSGQIVAVGAISEFKHGIVCSKGTPIDVVARVKKHAGKIKFN